MVGLSVVLEGQKGKASFATSVINKATMMINTTNTKPFSEFSHYALPYQPRVYNNYPYLPPNPDFLDKCFLCKQRLLLGKDVYMYKGDRGFCSVECRYNQIMMDEDEIVGKEMNCSMLASTSSGSSYRGSNGNQGAGGFASEKLNQERKKPV